MTSLCGRLSSMIFFTRRERHLVVTPDVPDALPSVPRVPKHKIQHVQVLAPEHVPFRVVAVHDRRRARREQRHVRPRPRRQRPRRPPPRHRTNRRRLQRPRRAVHPKLLPPAGLLDQHREPSEGHGRRHGPRAQCPEHKPLQRVRRRPSAGAIRREKRGGPARAKTALIAKTPPRGPNRLCLWTISAGTA